MEFEPKKLVFFPSGRLGNAIFRYMACAVVNIMNPNLEYTLSSEFKPPTEKFVYYPGVDHLNDDYYQTNKTDSDSMMKEAAENNSILGFNTLGFFKQAIDVDNLTENNYINKNNGQGIFVKTCLTLNDDNFFDCFYQILKYFHVSMNGFFQFGHIYLKYKSHILNYMEGNKAEHFIQTNQNEKFLIRDILDDIILPTNKQYDIVIHIRLDDFRGRKDFIEIEHYFTLFETLVDIFEGRTICLVYQSTTTQADANYIAACLDWFKTRNIPLQLESNSLLVDFNIMKQAKILICSMSTLAWTAAYLSRVITHCYMPNYNFSKAGQPETYFHKPIPNTILYNVKTTPSILGQIKAYIITLPEFPERLARLDSLNQELAAIGLEPTIYNGVHGKDIDIHDAASMFTKIKHITWQNTTYFYNLRVRLNGVHMTRGEFGCAWSQLNLLRQLLTESFNVNYYLIMEDDVELVKPIGELYDLLDHIPADADLCHLAESDYHPFVLTKQANAYFYERKKQHSNRNTAYVVSKKGARKILEYTKNSINVPIDDLFSMVSRLTPDFRFYVPANYYFKEQENVKSTIGEIN
jgi:GR25 family glycosyltransferase involved in LPS biosynthesis